VAASTPDANERQWAEVNLDGVRIYADFDEMLEQERLHAVVVASATSVHAEQALKAIAKGCHVLCEKPLSIDINVVSLLRYCFESRPAMSLLADEYTHRLGRCCKRTRHP
jgi:myo-inositol 2-dehydrogenase/D-chiro-inositol 1-dehydrogenase